MDFSLTQAKARFNILISEDCMQQPSTEQSSGLLKIKSD